MKRPPQSKNRLSTLIAWALLINSSGAILAPDETPGEAREWGFHPSMGEVVMTSPPGFTWRPQEGAEAYGIWVARGRDFQETVYEADGITYPVHCPPVVFEPGEYAWKFRFQREGEWSAWSSPRDFTLSQGAVEMPLPQRAELLSRIPATHPRLFVRPEWRDSLRQKAEGDLKSLYAEVMAMCDRLLVDPPPTKEPAKYPEDMRRGSDEWRSLWWGNRTYTQDTLHGAANLGFAWWMGGKEEYGQLARRILMECAEWDPRGSTGYAYNDEAAMPYNYHFARTYTYVHGLLSEFEREKCREVMRVRGMDMYDHLYPDHFWEPYGSHNNRAWHFLGELGIAFHGEIPEAADWVWAAANVFHTVYPVWGDSDGGWHEGTFYLNGYLLRFTYWADVMKAAFGIDALRKPFFSKLGYFPMYVTPPGTRTGGFGALTPRVTSQYSVLLMSILATQAQNPYWQWYVDELGFPEQRVGEIPKEDGYIAFIRGTLPPVEAKPPVDLPTSHRFEGIGQAALNSTILDGTSNVQVLLKSSPFGASSHGYESQNAFLLNVYGEPVFIRSGRRDFWGSPFHRNWMWETKSVNSILINGEGQKNYYEEKGYFFRGPDNVGAITEFQTGESFDWVVGEVKGGYPEEILERFSRRILYLKPDVVVIHDILRTSEPATFQWLLHAPEEMKVHEGQMITVQNGPAACEATFLWPQGLDISQTDTFDPEPEERVRITEYHLTASTVERAPEQQFVTVLRPHRAGQALSGKPFLQQASGGFRIEIPVQGGTLKVHLDGEEAHARLLGEDGSEKARFVRK